MANERSRNYLITWNEEKNNCDVEEFIRQLDSVKSVCVSTLEIGEENEYKHRHILISYNNARYFNSEKTKWLINGNQNHIEIVKNVAMSLRYCLKCGEPLINTFPKKVDDDNFSQLLIDTIKESKNLFEVFEKVPGAWHKANMVKLIYESYHNSVVNGDNWKMQAIFGNNDFAILYSVVFMIKSPNGVKGDEIVLNSSYDFKENYNFFVKYELDDEINSLLNVGDVAAIYLIRKSERTRKSDIIDFKHIEKKGEV